MSTFRVNTTISKTANDWLDKKSKETAMSKGAIINMAIANHIKETEVMNGFPKILEALEKQGIDLSDL